MSWVNNEVAAHRSIQARSVELAAFASLAWDAREGARKKLSMAGDRVSRATRIVESFRRSGTVNHTPFEPAHGGPTLVLDQR